MTIVTGSRVGPYEIAAQLGEGGMGIVFRARDTRLGRDVAIKMLPEHISNNPELKARFEREAQTLASLSHPHICPVFDVGQQDGVDYLVMEFLEGHTLAERLEKGAPPLDETLRIAIQIAGALDNAHRQGIVHRDVKPSNVMLTKSGAKLLDFGLAKLKQSVQVSSLSEMPTRAEMTAHGTILGTLQYMSPEQLEGQEADTRTDIFAFGAMLYEMVTGKKAFVGKSQASLIGAIMHADPPLIADIQPVAPPVLDRIVRKCLRKEPDQRWQSASDLGEALSWISENVFSSRTLPNVRPSSQRTRLAVIVFIIALALGAVTGYLSRNEPEAPMVRFTVDPPENTIIQGNAPAVSSSYGSISPDGRLLAFPVRDNSGKTMLWIRPIDSLVARPLDGTQDASYQFWSADSRSIGFFARGKLHRVDIVGGSVQTLGDAPAGRGGSWSSDNVILYSSGPIYKIAASGGEPVAVTTLTPEQSAHESPSFLPDGRHFLFNVVRAGAASDAATVVFIGDLTSPEVQRLLNTSTKAVYVSPGYVLFGRQGTLFAQRFDPSKLALAGEPIPIAEHVASETRFGGFSVSGNGVLAYRTGLSSGIRQLVWLDRTGKQGGTAGETRSFAGIALSPDGKSVAFHHHDDDGGDIWRLDVARGTSSRLTFEPSQDNSSPIWSPDGTHLAYASLRAGKWGIHQKRSDGTGNEELLMESDRPAAPMSWSPEGSFIVYQTVDPKTRNDLWLLTLASKQSTSLLDTSANESHPQISPDGKWIAYESDETGGSEIYVRPFPKLDGKWQISTASGFRPRWRNDSQELYYFTSTVTGQLMAVGVKVSGRILEAGIPESLFSTVHRTTAHAVPYNHYAVSANGQRFLITGTASSDPGGYGSSPITVTLNWPGLLKK